MDFDAHILHGMNDINGINNGRIFKANLLPSDIGYFGKEQFRRVKLPTLGNQSLRDFGMFLGKIPLNRDAGINDKGRRYLGPPE